MPLLSIRRALLSVSDKTGLVELARGLRHHSVSLLSTGGTRKALADAGLPVTDVAEYTGWPEMLDGRVKTLHPKVHGALLHRRDVPEHLATVAAHEILPIDLLVVNLYPFEKTVAKPGVAQADAIEQIDIGGPAMIRSAAKNHDFVAVLTDPGQYPNFMAELSRNAGKVSRETLRALALAALERTAAYDRAIADYLGGKSTPTPLSAPDADAFPEEFRLLFRRQEILRYGENPHQPAAVYVDPAWKPASAVAAQQLHGKELSYNNLLDLDAALAMVRDFALPAAVVIKHNNPCGAALAQTLVTAFRNAWAGDPLAAFGSVLGFNRAVDATTAAALVEPDRFVEAIIAPDFDADAVRLLTTVPTWKKNVRLLTAGDLNAHADARRNLFQNRPIEGGLLRQSADFGPDGFDDRKRVTATELAADRLGDLAFAWSMVKHVRSNAIVLAAGGALVGVGAGQMSRVDAVKIAIEKAGDRAKGSVLASDAFFPFRDNVDRAAAAGIVAIIQPGGSKRDQDSIDACNERDIAMYFTGMRHFRH